MKSQDEKESWVAWSKKIVITPSKWAWKMIQNSIGWKEIHNTVFIYRKILEVSFKFICIHYINYIFSILYNIFSKLLFSCNILAYN